MSTLPERKEVEDQFSEVVDFHKGQGRGKWQLRIRPDTPYAWFIAEDVCKILGIKNQAQALRALDEDEKAIISIVDDGVPHKLSIISEPGLYSLILRSRKPEAKPFRRWVTHDVLPTIRATGSYGALENHHKKLLEEIDRAQNQLRALKEHTIELKEALPSLKVSYGRNVLYALLRHVGVLQWDNKPKPEYLEKGYFVMEPQSRYSKKKDRYNWTMKLKVTKKGLSFLKELVQEWEVVKVPQNQLPMQSRNKK